VEINQADSGGILYLQKQILAIVAGIAGIIFLQFIDYKVFKHYYKVIYFLCVSILVYILFAAESVVGSQRWLTVGPVYFQPSEIAKILIILVLAAILEEKKEELKSIKGFIIPFIYMIIPFILIIKQNDLGTALVFIAIFIIMLYFAGANRKYMLIIFGGALLIITVLVYFHLAYEIPFPFLQEHQINRLVVFVNPRIDPQGISYNLIQSKIAIGSGRISGKGIFEGTQSQLDFLPEKHTDFIFSVIGEEFGLIGSLIIILLYLFLFWHLINIAMEAKDRYGTLVVTGIIAMFFFHVFENIGMTMGVMPITGIPLPFISYGGSSMLTSLLAIGLVININIHKKKLKF